MSFSGIFIIIIKQK
jgi:hypothetical protein